MTRRRSASIKKPTTNPARFEITRFGFRCFRLVRDLDAVIYPIELMVTPNRMGAFLGDRVPARRAA